MMARGIYKILYCCSPLIISGSIRVMDFSKDTVNAIPEEFQADYDNITGYDYNIDLIAPYDDVEALNLPKI